MAAAFKFGTSTYNSRGIDPHYIRASRGTDGGTLDWSGVWTTNNLDLVDRAGAIITVDPTRVCGYLPSAGGSGTGKDTQVYNPFATGNTTGPIGDSSEYVTATTPSAARNPLIRNASAWFLPYYQSMYEGDGDNTIFATRAQFAKNPQAIAEMTLHKFSIYALIARYSTSTNSSSDSGTYSGSNGEIHIVCANAFTQDGAFATGSISSYGPHGISESNPLRIKFTAGSPFVLDQDKWYAKPTDKLVYWDSNWTKTVSLQLFYDKACTLPVRPISGQQMGRTNPSSLTHEANYGTAYAYHVPNGTEAQLADWGDYTADNDTQDNISDPVQGTYRIKKVWANWRGTRAYTYTDYNDGGTVKCGARCTGTFLLNATSNTNTIRNIPTLTPVVDGDGGAYTGTGNNGTLRYIAIDQTDPGHFDNIKPMFVKIVAKADVASTATPTYNSRLFSEWDSTELGTYWLYADQESLDQRVWPTHVRPMAMTWTVETPVSSTESQSLIRYRKTHGAYRFKYKLKYAPLTKEQFKPFLNHIMACKGGYREFYWLLNDGQLDVRPAKAPVNDMQLGFDTNYVGDNYPVTAFQPTSSGSSLLYLDGFRPQDDGAGYPFEPTPGFDTPDIVTPYNVINKDQFLLSDSFKNNGDIAMSIVEQKANKFGEALVRVSHPTQQQLKAYETVVLNPTKIRVVLDMNSKDIDINTVQLYGFEVEFIAVKMGDA